MSQDKPLAVSLHGVHKSFKLPQERYRGIKQLVLNFYKGRRYHQQKVLRDISFEIRSGEFFGIVGRNGSGKSTLLKLLAGIYVPDKGKLEVRGSLTPFIELGVGFNPELTGRENVFLNGALLGFSHKDMLAMYDGIVAFAELEQFMDQKLKNYSSGMQVRLAFSIAIKVNSDILLLDEVLAVGDAAFQKKCFEYFRTLKKDKKTVIFISHDMNAVREYCSRAILIDNGQIVVAGSAEKVARAYTRLFLQTDQESQSDNKGRWGNGLAKLRQVNAEQKAGQVHVTLEGKFSQAVENPIFGLQIINPMGTKIFESNTKWERLQLGRITPGQTVTVTWIIPNIFTNGTQTIAAALCNQDATDFYDWWDNAASFTVDKDKVTSALTLPEATVTVKSS